MMNKFKLTNVSGENAKLWVYEDIGGFFGGISANDMRLALSEVDDSMPLDVHINSGGGDYFEGIAMHSLLTNRDGVVNVFVDGLAASAASLIAMAGQNIEMAAGSQMMIHEVRAGFYGTAGEFRNLAETMDSSNDDIVGLYKKRWNGTDKELRAALAAETWMNAETAVKFGLADKIAKKPSMAASVDVSKFHYKNIPDNFLTHCNHKALGSRLFDAFPELKEKKKDE